MSDVRRAWGPKKFETLMKKTYDFLIFFVFFLEGHFVAQDAPNMCQDGAAYRVPKSRERMKDVVDKISCGLDL